MSAPLWTSDELTAATGGRVTRSFSVTGLSIDSRDLAPGDLFVALQDVRDGHDFVTTALTKGAAGALVSRIPNGLAADAPLIVVPDVQVALEGLARAARARTRARVIGVTGSVGKTSTKEMLKCVLAGQGSVHAAENSLNNHWGVPLTLARMPVDCDVAVIEIGMNHPGEIAPLAVMAGLDVAMVTTVAAAHLAAFASVDGIAHEKAAIFKGLRPGGVAVINADIPTTPILVAAAQAAGAKIRLFGAAPGADYRLTQATQTQTATILRADAGGLAALFKVASPGLHFAMNALGVLAVVDALGLDIGLAACDLGQWQPPRGRGTRETILLDPVEDVSFDLIDDAFNANPASMAAALAVLAAAEPQDGIGRLARGRRIAILGDMLELGPDEAKLHAAIAALPEMHEVRLVHCVGPRSRALWQALPECQRGEWVETAADLLPRLRALVDAGDVVLVKGSKGIKVSALVDGLRKLGQSVAAITREAL